MLSWRRVSPHFYAIHPAPSCCTVAILFPRKNIRHIAAKLKGAVCKKGHAKDAVLDEIKKRHWGGNVAGVDGSGGGGDRGNILTLLVGGGGAYSIEPNLFKHIGLYSTLRKSATVDPFSM